MSAPPPDDEFKPVTAFDVSDENPAMIANHMRALQREVRAGFEMVTQKLLTAIERLNNRYDITDDRVTALERRATDAERRLEALEKKRRTAARKKK